MTGIDFDGVEVLTFDCYGTLIDWETGILTSLRTVLEAGAASNDELLESYAAEEVAAEAGPWLPYRTVLGSALSAVCQRYGVRPNDKQAAGFGGSVADWPAFPDSVAALAALRDRFQLGVITNCDDDLFAHSNKRLDEPFTWIVTAEQLRSYKPQRRNFELALERIGRPASQVVHVAQSLFHDHVPARELGLQTVWINRRAGRPGSGATPAANAEPDLVAPDMATFADMAMG